MAEENTDFKGRRDAFQERIQKNGEKQTHRLPRVRLNYMPVAGSNPSQRSVIRIDSAQVVELDKSIKRKVERNAREREASERNAENYYVK